MIRLLLAGALIGILMPLTGAASWGSANPAEMPPLQESSLVDRYRQALEIDPDNQALRYQFGIALLMAGSDREAIAEFSRVYPSLSDLAEINYNLALAYLHTGDPDSALLYLEQAENLGALDDPELYPLADAYFNLGLLYLDGGNDGEAIRLLRRVLDLQPLRVDLLRILGDIHARRGDIAQALADFALYLKTYPEDETTREYIFALHYNQGLQWLEQKRLAEAGSAFTEALRLSPESSLVLYYLGYIEYAGGRYASAAEYLRSALPNADAEVRSSVHPLLFNCSLALFEQRKLRQALNAIEPLLQESGVSAKELVHAGNIHFSLKEYASAFECYQRALAMEPNNRMALQNRLAAETGAINELLARGEALAQAQDFAGAMAAFEQGLSIDSADRRLQAAMRQTRTAKEQKAAQLFFAARQALAANQPLQGLSLVREGLGLAEIPAEGKALEEQLLASLTLELAQTLAEAGALLEQNRLLEAREAFSRVLELDPANLDAQQGLQAVAGKFQEAYMQALQRGEVALEEGQLAVALQAFSEALQLQPDSPEGGDGLRRAEALTASLADEELQAGRRALGSGSLEQAREHFEKSLSFREDPLVRAELTKVESAAAERQSAMLNIARSAAVNGDIKKARLLYEQFLTLYPEQEAGRQELAALHQQSAAAVATALAGAATELEAGRFSAAVAGFRRALEIDPGNAEAQRGLTESRKRLQGELSRFVADGQRALAKGDFSFAESNLKAALALDPYQAEAKAALRRLEGIRRSGSRPGSEDQLYLQGIEFYTRGKYEDAVAAWEQVLLLMPEHEKARMNIDKARRKIRQIKEFRGG